MDTLNATLNDQIFEIYNVFDSVKNSINTLNALTTRQLNTLNSSLNIQAAELSHHLSDLKSLVDTLNSTNTNQLTNLQSSVSILNTTSIAQVHSLESKVNEFSAITASQLNLLRSSVSTINTTTIERLNSFQCSVSTTNTTETDMYQPLVNWLNEIQSAVNTFNTTIKDELHSIYTSFENIQFAVDTLNVSATRQLNTQVNELNLRLSDLQTLSDTLNSTTANQLQNLQTSVSILNSTTIDHVNNLVSSVNTLNATASNRLRALESSQEQLQSPTNVSLSSNSGVTYIHWGSKDCRSGATRLYSGWMGGSSQKTGGGGVNRLCMPTTADYSSSLQYQIGVAGFNNLYQVEYQDPVKGTDGHTIPCVVCLVSNHSLLLKIPAAYTCPSDWTREYYGYLMSEGTTQSSHSWSTFECVDKEQESFSDISNTGESLLGHNTVDCNQDICSQTHNYNSQKQLNCVVCSK